MAAAEQNEPDDLISQADAAQLRGVTRAAIGYLISEGRIRTFERYGRPLVSRAEVEAYEPMRPGPKPNPAAKRRPKGGGVTKPAKKWAAKKGGKK